MQDPHHVYLDLDVINNNYTQEGLQDRICGLRKPGTRLFWRATALNTCVAS